MLQLTNISELLEPDILYSYFSNICSFVSVMLWSLNISTNSRHLYTNSSHGDFVVLLILNLHFDVICNVSASQICLFCN